MARTKRTTASGVCTVAQNGHKSHNPHRMVEPNRMATGIDMGPPGLEPGTYRL